MNKQNEKIAQMNKKDNATYHSVTGRRIQNGEHHTFHGYIELENEKYNSNTSDFGMVDIQHFRGITEEAGEDQRNLILGTFISNDELGRKMTFCEVNNNPLLSPLSYSLQQDKDGKYRGGWENNLHISAKESAGVSEVKQLTAEQVAEQRVWEYLQKGFTVNEMINLPPEMLKIAMNYQTAKYNTINKSAAIKKAKQIRTAGEKGLATTHKQQDTNQIGAQ